MPAASSQQHQQPATPAASELFFKKFYIVYKFSKYFLFLLIIK